MELLKKLCSVHATSGDEGPLKNFLLEYIQQQQKSWKVKPQVLSGEDLHDCIILVFGKPRTAIFAHLDSIGYTVRYGNELVPVGGPANKSGFKLWANLDGKAQHCKLKVGKDRSLSYTGKVLPRGTPLAFFPDFRETEEFVQCCYLDNRMGVYTALKVAETLKDGIVVFSCYEEHGGGTAGYLARFIQEKYGIRQALISDITWVTPGVQHGKGVVISMRDIGIPRRSYLQKIIRLAEESRIPFQLEVEGSGGSDGTELQRSALLMDWCFIGAPEGNVHSPDEIVHKRDLQAMIDLYKFLMEKL